MIYFAADNSVKDFSESDRDLPFFRSESVRESSHRITRGWSFLAKTLRSRFKSDAPHSETTYLLVGQINILDQEKWGEHKNWAPETLKAFNCMRFFAALLTLYWPG